LIAITAFVIVAGKLPPHHYGVKETSTSAKITLEGSVSENWLADIRAGLQSARSEAQLNLHVSMGALIVRVYPTHLLFARALHRLDDSWPQAFWDNASNVVDGVLLLGPRFPGVRHRLAHVYAEWAFDRLTHNTNDAELRPAWLYDGLAELEAQRVERTPCDLHGHRPLPLAVLAAPRQWSRRRATALAGVEYCEAQQAAARVVARVGWSRVVRRLHQSSSWAEFAGSVLGFSGVLDSRDSAV
jgi:hypothetical protein